MVINGVIDISMTAIVGKMVTVAFIGDVPLYRPLSEKKLKYLLRKYSPDALVLMVKGNIDEDICPYAWKDVYSPLYIFAYDYDILKRCHNIADGLVWFIPYDMPLKDELEGLSFRVSKDVFEKHRKWFFGKEKRVEVVTSTLKEPFVYDGNVLLRKFWL